MNVIETKELTKVYGDLVAVDNISFEVRKGEIFALLGPNGAGKTTTVEMLEMIRKPTSGEIYLFGDKPNEKIKERIGVLPQEFQSFERLTVRETLLYFSSLYKNSVDVDELIELIDLNEKRDELYKNLSSGLKQRVGVAIALVNDPDLVFLDEPTTGLDPSARRNLWEVIKNLKKQGKTIFLTTHYMEEAEYLADRVAIMNRGKIIDIGEPNELIEKYGGKPKVKIWGINELEGYEYKKMKGGIEIVIENEKEIPSIISSLDAKKIKFERIEIERANLEDVFIKLTGRRLADESNN